MYEITFARLRELLRSQAALIGILSEVPMTEREIEEYIDREMAGFSLLAPLAAC